MKLRKLFRWIAGLVAALILQGITASAQTVLPPGQYNPTTPPAVVFSTPTLTNGTNAVTIAPLATVVFQSAASVNLKPGFRATSGSKFFVAIGAIVDSDGDGIPDVWERAYNLDPANAADAGKLTVAGDGLTYLQTFKLGGFPLVPATLQNQTLPPTYKLVILTPGSQLFGVGNDWTITPLVLP